MSSNDSDRLPRGFRRLVSLWLDGAASESQLADLEHALEHNPRAAEVFARYAAIEAQLVTNGQSQRHCVNVLNDLVGGVGAPPVSGGLVVHPPRYFGRRVRWALAVAAAIVGMLGGHLLLRSSPSAGDPGPTARGDQATSAPGAAQVVGSIVATSDHCRWLFDRGGPTSGGRLGERAVTDESTLRVADGDLTLELDERVELTLFGPALMEIESADRARLLSGRLRAKISPGAEGFRVDVPQATVVDLGTEFGVEVDAEGRSDVVVFDGMVNVDMGAADGTTTTRAFETGEALRLDEELHAARLPSVWSDRFEAGPTAAALAGREPLILAVEDNIDRIWRYYEIVHGGMREDAKALVSSVREHEWNGLTRLGMPPYLVGGDYVRMFKGDQINPDIRLSVTLAEPSRLFVLFDRRVPPPAWLEADFHRTGDRLGLDMGPWDGPTGDEYEYGDGPGKSVDRVVVVWESNERVSGVVELGSTESLLLGTLMYGIVAQPADFEPSDSSG